VLTTFPGVFSGIGEFSVHKEFVSAKISGETASLTNPALDRIFDFAAEAGLVVLLHNDIDMPFRSQTRSPTRSINCATSSCATPRPPSFGRTSAWAASFAHEGATGDHHQAAHESALSHVYLDISWDEVAKYAVASRRRPSARPR